MRAVTIGCAMLLAFALCFSAATAEEATTLESLCAEIALESADVQAWLEIPDTNISYPVMQHLQDDEYYLDHNCYGKADNYGAIYTQSEYNAFNFSDPVIVIYGHRMNNGSMFGTLQKYYSDSFDEHRTIYLYLPNGEIRTYTVFAAMSYSDTHLLHSNNFYSRRVFNRFFDEVFATRKLALRIDQAMRPQPEEQVIILSTCIKGDSSQRYLVMAKLNEESI